MQNIFYLHVLIVFLLGLSTKSFGQFGQISGNVRSDLDDLEYVHVQLVNTNSTAYTDSNGYFSFQEIPFGEYKLRFSYIGFTNLESLVKINPDSPGFHKKFELNTKNVIIDQIVVTGTKTFKKQTQSPVIVNVISSELLDNVQACSLSEGLKFQPGLRVETDCQTCNYTQLRMNGLGGGYSQILINGRPIFSPLTGLYGMEQIPTNMIDRIEIVRGGGSALYGSSAIGGTVNVITKTPKNNSFDINYTNQFINDQGNDRIIYGNGAIVNKNGKSGLSLFFNNRKRNAYDHNEDNFSELPELKNNSFGANLFFKPSPEQKLEISFSKLNEYRYGGEMVDKTPHLALQSEEREHDVYIGSLDYQLNFNDTKSSIITFLAGQKTNRDHYTGIFPDEAYAIEEHLINPPYGTSENTTFQVGSQINHRVDHFFGSPNVLTIGGEYVYDDVYDNIDAYNYKVDQLTKNLGFYVQSDWELNTNFNLLTGLRTDKHNLLGKMIVSPRFSILYRLQQNTQFRMTWGTGFRAPQAFDTDLHIAFAAGGVSRISLSKDLQEERSKSISASINYDKATETYVAGFTLEAFHTKLKNAFYLYPLGEDNFGERFEKRNGSGSKVQGITLELRANYQRKAQLEAGMTFQSSLFNEAVKNIEGLESMHEFLRTPNQYGYAALSYFPTKKFNTTLNVIYTGSMTLAHFAGAPEQIIDSYINSSAFTEISFKAGYTFDLRHVNTGLEIFGGIKNMTNAYQNDFDSGKNRDSNYVYGPSLPRTIFLGLRLKSF